jgi:hypothetical protein
MALLSSLIPIYQTRMIDIVRHAYVATCNNTQRRTPVDIGDLQKAWTPDINRVNTSNAGGDASEVAGRAQIGDVLTYTNGKDYAGVIEYSGRRTGTPHSQQAPHGMRDISVAEWDDNVREAIRVAG